MDYGTIEGVDKKISRIVLGSMIINRTEREKSFALLDTAAEAGITAIDTAHVYAGGDSERAIGEWMAERGNRDATVILSKGCHHNADRRRVTPFDLASDLHDSLTRLKTDYIDVYVLHRDDPDVPVGPIVEALNEQREAGRIRAFGGSNWTHERLREANAYAEAHGLVPFRVSSPNFGLAEQVENPWGDGCVSLSGPAREEARRYHAEAELAVFAYSSLARGLFSDRVTRENFKETADGASQRAYCHEVNFRRLDRVRELAEAKGVSVPQIALAWVLRQPLDVYALVGAASGAEIRANLAALELPLTEDELAWLDLRQKTR